MILDGGGGGGIAEIPGEPDALRAGAAGVSATAAQLGGLANELAGSLGGVQWSGLAAMAARIAVVAAANPLEDAEGHLTSAAGALRRYASELEAAQREADQARARLGDALSAAANAAISLGALQAEEEPDEAAVSRMGDRLYSANLDAAAARTAGAQAFDRAEQAARAAGAAFAAIAAAAPEPPPPPPPPPAPKEDDGGFFGGLKDFGGDVMGGLGDGASAVGGGIADGATSAAGAVADAWNEAGNTGSPWDPGSPAFGIDVLEGAAGAVWGVGELAWQGVQSTDQYARIDPEGSEAARQGFADGAEYAWGHPWETAKQVLGIHHFENGEPGKFTGEFGITALATLASGGGAAALKGASGASKVSKVADDVVDASQAARAADDVSDLKDLGRLDYSDRLAREAENFAEPIPKPVTASRSTDEWLVNVGDSSRTLGEGRSAGWWVPLEDARKFDSVEQLRNDLALPERWSADGPFQAKDEVLVARIPAGQETTRLEGTAAPQPLVPDPRPGGGPQIFFKEFDGTWIEARLDMDDFLAGKEPALPGLPPR